MPPLPPGAAQAAPGGGGGGTVVKIILIVVAIIVAIFLLIGAVVGYGIWRVAHAVHEASHGGTVTIPGSSGGSFSINSNKTYSAAELGIDIYPGATSARGSMKMTLPTGSMVTGVFETADSKDQVIAFYKAKLGADASVSESDDSAVMTLKRSDKEQVMVTVSSRANESNGKTKFVILHTVGK
jgi:hypothetical protein